MRSSARACVKMVDEFRAWVAQLVERVLGKDEVTGSIPVPGSRNERSTAGGTQRESLGLPSRWARGQIPSPAPDSGALRGARYGEGKIRTQQAAREHRDDWAHRPPKDHADRGDHQGALQAQPQGAVPGVRFN